MQWTALQYIRIRYELVMRGEGVHFAKPQFVRMPFRDAFVLHLLQPTCYFLHNKLQDVFEVAILSLNSQDINFSCAALTFTGMLLLNHSG